MQVSVGISTALANRRKRTKRPRKTITTTKRKKQFIVHIRWVPAPRANPVQCPYGRVWGLPFLSRQEVPYLHQMGCGSCTCLLGAQPHTSCLQRGNVHPELFHFWHGSPDGLVVTWSLGGSSLFVRVTTADSMVFSRSCMSRSVSPRLGILLLGVGDGKAEFAPLLPFSRSTWCRGWD